MDYFKDFCETFVSTQMQIRQSVSVGLEVELVSFRQADSTSAHVTDADTYTHKMSVQISVVLI